jgi:uncharacterized protein (DUF433 family)
MLPEFYCRLPPSYLLFGVEFIIDLLAQGWSEAEILENYPGVSHEDIQACLKYASETLKSEGDR